MIVPTSTRPFVALALDQAYSDLYSVTLYAGAGTATDQQTLDNLEVYVSNTTNATLALSTGVPCVTGLGLVSSAPAFASGNSLTQPVTVLCSAIPNAQYVVLARKPVTSSETLTLDEIVVSRAGKAIQCRWFGIEWVRMALCKAGPIVLNYSAVWRVKE